jgi:hypothetical protein
MTSTVVTVSGRFPSFNDWTRALTKSWFETTQSEAIVIGLALHGAVTDTGALLALLRYEDDRLTVLEVNEPHGRFPGTFEINEQPAGAVNRLMFHPEMLSRALVLEIACDDDYIAALTRRHVSALADAGIVPLGAEHIGLERGGTGRTDPSYIVGAIQIEDAGKREWVVIVIRDHGTLAARTGVRRTTDPVDHLYFGAVASRSRTVGV